MSSFYTAYGLTLESSISLNGVFPVVEGENPHVDIVIHKGECLTEQHSSTFGEAIEFHQAYCLLSWPHLGAMRLLEGRTIIVQPYPGVADDLLRPFLVSAALPLLLCQRNYLIIHASAVALIADGEQPEAVAFLGLSGQGKSTMATALYKRGHFPIADDVIAIPNMPRNFQTGKGQNLPILYPGPAHFKLRLPSVAAFNENRESLALWSGLDESRVLPIKPLDPSTSAALSCCYVLEDADTTSAELLGPEDALLRLSENSYGARLFTGVEMAHNFVQCSRLVQQIPFFRLQRPRDFKCLPDVVRFVEEHHRSLERRQASEG